MEQEKLCFCGKGIIETTTTLTRTYNGSDINIENVPVLKCTVCGEEYFDDAILDLIDAIIKQQKNPTKDTICKISEKDLSFDSFETAVFTEYRPNLPVYNLKELFAYCRANGIKEPSNLSEDELKQFENS